ncbi:hypothetical protein KSP35_13050 [Aquihabitans sp. G128]|uniref:hypothetical protein n=1 Tax=Aquihabitans sp. G128 TaxID=2849779 RepID=UPI001C23D60C|nr:hypothetical protein [Aquihabitans sp. G128]QXC59330.1 hypothetical protein KSP35_13050 [Aquihabitans sp. G128]
MAASLTGALKALIEPAGLGLSVWRDDLATGQPTGPRYVTVAEGISTTTERLSGDHDGDPVTELVQLDLWQPWRAKTDGDPAEDYALPRSLRTLLHGARLTAAPMIVRSCTVDDVVRLVEREANTVHHAFTLRLRREA